MTQRDDGATPLDESETLGLKQFWISNRDQLNELEFANISRALADRYWHRLSTSEILDDLVLRQLHKAMFSNVWEWAGKYRTTEKNIGCDSREISVRVRELCQSAKLWFNGGMPIDEAGCKFHFDLVAIHPFANGNGRHARAATNLLLESVGSTPFTWGRTELLTPSETRSTYISALRAADRGDLGPLLAFVRT
ncbi:MAG: mobile mystery protein B [Acidobacteria bacterium]|nr:mobile mystery protein B [Acidobacteriota bacterium]